MTSENLKNILNEDFVKKILTTIGCHNLSKHITSDKIETIRACNKDGDNPNAIVVYLDNFFVENHTRNLFQNLKYRDIISLVEFVENLSPQKAIKRICDICQFDYYEKQKEKPVLLEWLSFIENGKKKSSIDELMTPLNEKVLKQFKLKPNKKWIDEGITKQSQRLYQIGFDIISERIVIPIRDEIGNLVGIKGRLYNDNHIVDDKYIYLYSCPKSKILFGLYNNYNAIKEKNEIIIVEGEKSVLKLNSIGFSNVVATGSKNISSTQIDKLLRLNVDITIAFDKDVKKKELQNIVKEIKTPLNLANVYLIDDKLNLLNEKDSPSDDSETWEVLYNNFKIKV